MLVGVSQRTDEFAALSDSTQKQNSDLAETIACNELRVSDKLHGLQQQVCW
jgi:hypothetical protein